MKRILSALLAALTAVSVLAACGETADNGKTAVTAADTETVTEAETETEPAFEEDDLPADLDFEGASCGIFCWTSWDKNEFFVEDDTGEIVDSAVYARNLAVEERLNVKLDWRQFPRDSSAYGSDLTNAVSQQNSSGDCTYDAVACYGMRVASCATSGSLSNLRDLPYIDLSRPWYYESATMAGTLAKGHTYFCAGDLSYNALARMSGIFVNMDMIGSYNLDDPYDLVLDGVWTIDKMYEMMDGLYADLDGDGKKSDGDQFGLMCANDQIQTLYYGTGSHFITHDADDRPVLSDDVASERTMALLEKYQKVFGDDAAFKNPKGDVPDIFDEGRTLFYVYPLGHVAEPGMRESTVDYGFIPQPKFREEDDYHASVTNAVTLFAVPLVIESDERASALLECLASEGYRRVSPVVFEQAYKVKYNNDGGGRQTEVFDIIRENALFDLGKIFCSALFDNFSNGVIGQFIWDAKDTYASSVASKTESWNKALAKLTENLQLD